MLLSLIWCLKKITWKIESFGVEIIPPPRRKGSKRLKMDQIGSTEAESESS